MNPSSSSSSPYPILCASFNQDNSGFCIGSKDGFRIFSSDTGRLCYERAAGAHNIVEMLFGTSLLMLVGAGEQPSLSPRRLCLFNSVTGTPLRDLTFLTSIVAVRANRKRLVVILQEKTIIYDSNSLKILDTIDTVPNSKGICAFSPMQDCCYLAIPASTAKGSVLVYDVMKLHSRCQISAHNSPISAMVFSSDGVYLATASEQGTIIRVHLISQETKSYSLRRGSYSTTIYSLSFSPSPQIPEILIATSSSGSIHIFCLENVICSRNKRSNSLFASVIPSPINDAFDSNHFVVHNAVPAGVRSCAIVRHASKVSGKTSPSSHSLRVSILVITYLGYFQEYSFNITGQNKSMWTLEREKNLLLNTSSEPVLEDGNYQ